MAAAGSAGAQGADVPAPAPTPDTRVTIQQLTVGQQTSLRCAAAFAIVAARQTNGGGAQYPDLTERGREFFVRSTAGVMDDSGLGRDDVAAILTKEAATLEDDRALAALMPPCLLLLDASGV